MAKQKQTQREAPVRGYDGWSISDLRSKLVRRTADELKRLRDYERSGKARKGALDAIDRALERLRLRGDGARGRTPAGRPGKGLIERATERVARFVGVGIEDIDRDALLDRLSEFLEHERTGVKLYERARQRLTDEPMLEQVIEFLEQTRKHERFLIEMIRELGGDPDDVSAAARLDRERAEGLFAADAEGDLGQLAILQNLMIAEWVDHKNWKFLSEVARRVADAQIRAVLKERAAEVEAEEDDHFRWAERAVEEWAFGLIEGGLEEEEEEEEERERAGGEEGQGKEWPGEAA
jgi:hypothetical protein